MLLRVPLLGRGVRGDPLRAELPSYTLVDVDYAGRIAIVDVPDTDVPGGDAIRRELGGHLELHRKRSRWPAQAALDDWHGLLDERYAEHRGRFRPIPD